MRITTLLFLFLCSFTKGQNLLDTSTWSIGSGSVSGFNQNGTTSENSRELGTNHIGENVILWKATPDAFNNDDGGWNTEWLTVNHATSYRFSIWIKKTNSNDGFTYFGFYANNNGSLTLAGDYHDNPYFWYGDLPQLNRWYLLVGYVYGSSYTGTTHTGGIYDGTTGEKVITATDYKLKNTVTSIKHRAYLYYDTNTLDRQYFYAPRIDPINGNELTIQELLKINNSSKLAFTYDNAGNQNQRFYCSDCSSSATTSRKQIKEEQESSYNENEEEADDESVFDARMHIYPNPTSGLVTLKLEDALLENIRSINLHNVNSLLIKSIIPKNNIQLDLSSMASGVYFIHIHIEGGKSITKKIIKN